MGTRIAILVGLLLTACGRLDFGVLAKDPPDAASPDAPPDAPAVLACGSPQRFAIDATKASVMTAAATPDGFAVFGYSAPMGMTGSLDGWAYRVVGGHLVAGPQQVSLATGGNGRIAAASGDAEVLVSSAEGNGAMLLSLDAELAALSPPTDRLTDGAPADAPLAASGVDGLFAYVFTASGGAYQAQRIAFDGTAAGPAVVVAAATEAPKNVVLVPAQPGYALAYHDPMTSPATATVELLDDQLDVVAGPVSLAPAFDGEGGPFAPQIVWSPAANVYLVAWWDKTATEDDDIWLEILGPQLEVLVPAFDFAPSGHDVEAVSDGIGFWVTWRTYTTDPETLMGAYVASDGTTSPRAVPGSGGGVGGATMLARDGQAVLVWLETGGTGADLYFDPLCAP